MDLFASRPRDPLTATRYLLTATSGPQLETTLPPDIADVVAIGIVLVDGGQR